MARYCPEWLFAGVSALIARRFIVSTLPLSPFAVKYAEILSEKYMPIAPEMFEASAEGFLRVIIEAQSEDADDILTAYCYHNLELLPNGERRKYKSIFSNALDGSKEQEYSADQAIKKFKPFVYMLRTKPSLSAPVGWQLDKIPDGDWVTTLDDVEVSILDTL